MRFNLVDRITECVPGRRIRAVKTLSLSEEYLADHFAEFPVMPGVLMLEALLQSATWLVRVTEHFAHSLIVLQEARNVTYRSFVRPGETLRLEVDCTAMADDHSRFTGRGVCDDSEVLKARLTLRHTNLADEDPRLAAVDRELIAHARTQFALIGGDSFVTLASTS